MYKNIRRKVPMIVLGELDNSSETIQELFSQEYSKKRKYVSTAYLLFFCFGLHHVYIKSWGQYFLFLLSCCTIVIGLVWQVIDLFKIPSRIHTHNEDLAKKILIEIKTIRGNNVPASHIQTSSVAESSHNENADKSIMEEMKRRGRMQLIYFGIGATLLLLFLISHL